MVRRAGLDLRWSKKRTSPENPGRSWSGVRELVSIHAQRSQSESHVLELLERTNLDDRGRRLGLEHDFFLRERADAFACLGGWLANGGDLEQTGENELADGVLLDVTFDDVGQAVENSSHLLAAEFGVRCDLVQDLGLGETVFDCCFLSSHAREFSEWAANVKTSD